MVNHLTQEPAVIHNQKKKGFSFRDFTRVLRFWRYLLKKSSSDQPQRNGDETEDRGNIPQVNIWTNDEDGRSSKCRVSLDACFPRQDSFPSRKKRVSRSPSPSPSPDPNPNPDPNPKPSFMHKQGSMRSTTTERNGLIKSLSRNTSRVNPIMFSNSNGVVKPPPIEKQLECTLEELCYGSTKNIKVTRDVITESGQRVEQEETLSINVEPGWKKGTKITFEGMGNELPRSYAADITFVIAEKQHLIFQRDGDDLELTIEIPLVKALTECTVPIPLLGGEEMELKIDEIIQPGHQKIITGQGMPTTKEEGSRGNLKVLFQIKFPTELTDEQRASAVRLRWHDAGTYNKNIEEWPQRGRANGSIRFEIEQKHAANAGLVSASSLIQPIKDKYAGLTFADLFQLASATAIEFLLATFINEYCCVRLVM